MNKFIDRLPQDIIDYIIPFTYQLQNKPLLCDIKNYKETKDLVLELYYKWWIIYMGETEPEHKYWLINNIIAYINNYKATMYGYVEDFYNIFRRNQYLQTHEDINNYVSSLENKSVDRQINIIWSLLTPKERNDIINDFLEDNPILTTALHF